MMTETVVNVQEAPNNNTANKPQQPQQADSALSWIKINLLYFKTTPGLLKIAEVIFGIVCMALASPARLGGTHFFLFVATSGFIGSLIWVAIYLLGVREAFTQRISWILTELVNTGIVAVAYILASIIQIIVAAALDPLYYFRGSYIAAGVFGLINAGVFSFATYLLHLQWKSSSSTAN